MRKLSLLTLLLVLLVPLGTANAEGVDLQALIKETQRIKQEGSTVQIVSWLPNELWMSFLRGNPAIPAQQADWILDLLRGYTIIAIAGLDMSTPSQLSFTPREAMSGTVSLSIPGEPGISPLAEEELSSEMVFILNAMKPAMAQSFGSYGEGLELFCFPGRDENGDRLLDPRGNKRFTIHVFDSEYHWRLPLGCVLPPMFDVETGERFPGNYSYNPFTGAALERRDSATGAEG